MSKKNSSRYANSGEIRVWDTGYSQVALQREVLAEGLRASMFPWSPQTCVSGRVECRTHKHGTLARIRFSPDVRCCPCADAASDDRLVIVYVLRGAVRIDQAGKSEVARGGDFVIYRSAIPTTITHTAPVPYRALVVTVQISRVPNFQHTRLIVCRERMFATLSACASFLVRNFRTLKSVEVDFYIEALLALLPVESVVLEQTRNRQNATKPDLQPKLIDFIEDNIRNPQLTVEMAAKHFGISTRYVHKICAATGKTFSATVAARRLDCVRRELEALEMPRRSVSSLAFYWGFDSISAFNRAFKRRFGAPPRTCIARAKGAVAGPGLGDE